MWRAIGVLAACTLVVGCQQAPLSALHPEGPGAYAITHIWWVMCIGAAILWLFMVVLGVYASLHRQRTNAPVRVLLVGGGLVLPVVVLAALLVYGVRTGHALLPLPLTEAPYKVEVVAHQWWWEIRYPHNDGGTLHSANEIHIPVGRPVDMHVTSNDVVHSFWAPRLGGKIDAIPGRTNIIRLQADRAATYDGACAEFCGAQHARMHLKIIAHDPESLQLRLNQLAGLSPNDPTARSATRSTSSDDNAPGNRPAGTARPNNTTFSDTASINTAGRAAFEQHCAQCHSVDTRSSTTGLRAAPNLADIAYRTTLAAGTMPNTTENLRAWIHHPQAYKPGSHMPELNLSADEVDRVARYLEGRAP